MHIVTTDLIAHEKNFHTFLISLYSSFSNGLDRRNFSKPAENLSCTNSEDCSWKFQNNSFTPKVINQVLINT